MKRVGMRHVLMDESSIEVKYGEGGRIEIWLRGVLYTHTTDPDTVHRVIQRLQYNNRKIAC